MITKRQMQSHLFHISLCWLIFPVGTAVAVPSTTQVSPATHPAATQPSSSLRPAPLDKSAVETFERIYGARFKKLMFGTPGPESVVLAKNLMKDAGDLPKGSPMIPVLLTRAWELTLALPDSAGRGISVTAMETLLKLDPAQKTTAQLKLLKAYEEMQKFGGGDAKRWAIAHLVKTREMSDELCQAGDYASAIQLLEGASVAAKALDSTTHARHEEDLRATRLKSVMFKRSQELEAGLARAAEAQRAQAFDLVKLLLLELDDPNVAMNCLPLLGDKTLGRIVRAAAANPSTLDEAAAKQLADWYRAGAETAVVGKATALVRARVAYDRAISLHKERDVVWLEMRSALAELGAAIDKLPKETLQRISGKYAGRLGAAPVNDSDN